MQIKTHPSPNFGPRKNGLIPRYVVLHYTAMDSASAAIDRLSDPAAEVSAHYVICKTGTITRLVPEDMRAWHAGAGEWCGQSDMNSRSIGIELDNTGQTPFPEAQMTALLWLLPDILARWAIPPDGVIGHSDMAPGRKSDPGPHFDWPRLERLGLARARGTAQVPADPETFRARAQNAGYTAPIDDDTLLAAVRLRYRPNATGPITSDDLAVLLP